MRKFKYIYLHCSKRCLCCLIHKPNVSLIFLPEFILNLFFYYRLSLLLVPIWYLFLCMAGLGDKCGQAHALIRILFVFCSDVPSLLLQPNPTGSGDHAFPTICGQIRLIFLFALVLKL